MNKWIIRILVVMGIGLSAFIFFAASLYLHDNYHVVIPGELYRSAQLTPESLARYHRRDGFRSVLNLRGAKPGADWYDAEVQASAQLGLTHADFKLSARKVITPAEVTALMALMRDLPKPILIHCKQGADRTGFASAMYMAMIGNAGFAASDAQLSLRYGHIGIPYVSEAYPMDLSWQREVATMEFSN